METVYWWAAGFSWLSLETSMSPQFTSGDVDTLSQEMGQHMGMDPQMYDRYVHKLVVPASLLEGHFSTYFPNTDRDGIYIFELR